MTTPDRSRIAYLPALDGMRAIGVVSVICAHAATVQPVLIHPASYMFVDMFFVISGYLITALLLSEQRSTGRVSLKAFYVRRFTRLYPVIFLLLSVMIVTGLIWPEHPATASWAFVLGTAFYFANFVAIVNHADTMNAWIPVWSLSIEEQFYAVWPITLIVTMGATRRLRRPLVLVTVLTVVMWVWRSVSIQRAVSHPSESAAESFRVLTDAWHLFNFSTFQRPDGLLIGCAVALIMARPGTSLYRLLTGVAWRLRFVAPVVLAALVLATEQAAPWQAYWGLALFNICIALFLVSLLVDPDWSLSRALQARPLTWLGRRSYFIYATHLAVLTVTLDLLGMTSLPEIALTVAVIFALSGVSYRWFEDPARRWGQQVSRRIISASGSVPKA